MVPYASTFVKNQQGLSPPYPVRPALTRDPAPPRSRMEGVHTARTDTYEPPQVFIVKKGQNENRPQGTLGLPLFCRGCARRASKSILLLPQPSLGAEQPSPGQITTYEWLREPRGGDHVRALRF